MNNHQFGKLKIVALGTCFLSAILTMGIAHAKTPLTKAEADKQTNMLLVAVKKGDDLWHNPTLGTNGLACGNCHPDGSATNPHTWPKYQTNLGKVGTLRDMINWCIEKPNEGEKLAADSEAMKALEAYIYYSNRNSKLDPGRH